MPAFRFRRWRKTTHNRRRQLKLPAIPLTSRNRRAAQHSRSPSTASSANGTGSPTDTAAATAPAANAPKETHNKGKTDIDDIGDRNVGSTGRSLGNWYSIDTDIKIGKQYAMMVESSARMIQDPVINEYVNRVGQNLVRNSDAKVPFTIKVVDSDDINAFALPGGFFYVNSGLILAADNEAELAGVMAHEISHVVLRHATREMTRQNYVQLSTVPLMFVIHSWGVYEAVNMAMSLALPVTFMKFSRDFEARSRLLWPAIHVQSGIRPAGLHRLLREDPGAGKAEAGSAGQGLRLASADARNAF